MSDQTLPALDTGPAPVPERRAREIWQFVGLLLVLLLGIGGTVLPSPSAQAASAGPAYGNQSDGYLGALVAESDGKLVYCLDILSPSPLGQPTSGPTTVTQLDTVNGHRLSDETLARLNYVMARWGDSTNPQVTAAVQLYVWTIVDPGAYAEKGGYYIGLIPEGERATVMANLATMEAEAEANATVSPKVTLAVQMRDQYNGTLTVGVEPASMSGTATLTNARFADGSTSKALPPGNYAITGTPPSGAPAYKVGASASYAGAGLGSRVNLYATPGAQRLMAAGTPGAATATAESPLIELDFQPVIGTQVAARYVEEGDAFVDQLAVETTGPGDWIVIDGAPVELSARGTLYGPFAEQPQESETVPEGAPIAGTETLVLDHGAGPYHSSGETVAEESGFYTWVWEIDKDEQGANAKYIRESFRDWFGRVSETHVVPFQPVAESKSDARLAVPGDMVTDTITVESSNGEWLQIDGVPIPVTFTGTAYQVPGTLPPAEQAEVPENATALGTVEVVANAPGVYTSPPVEFPGPGFVTWVWEMRLDQQPEQYRDYIAADWTDQYGIPVETTSVRHPVKITSEVKEYNVHVSGRAFDDIVVSGFPDDHGDFTGDGYWGADRDVIEHTVYGPFESDEQLTDDLDLGSAPVLTKLTTPARNATYRVGFTDADRIQPTEPGFYVVVSVFEGDDRVQPFRSSPADVLERFYVPKPPPGVEVRVSTKAQPEAWVGDPFSDTAVVEGKNLPDGSYLVFRAFGPYAAQPAKDAEGGPFFTSEKIPVDGPGEYQSGATTVDRAGLVFWVETLYTKEGEVLAEGYLGAPGETTVVKDKPGTPPSSPEHPGSLATTGSTDWVLPAGIAAVVLLTSGGVLLFGRRLAQRRAGAEQNDGAQEPTERDRDDGEALDGLDELFEE
ncbi:hypothetical protein H490_0101735 [Leucobacter sp. UCD-THU]|uniref:hypothetical protein n=1 Tax=Leucobacter sp. UCD-THU TaxID=1292023 RepID=UPI0003662834|nr:hypothetical protein [Leucobacter sp. UCD-THU]EYT56667.1 hypothetical protein H490_0101735 [Leucobacter sp. UCD-THU]